jgi:hypothetical protein
MRHCDGSRMTLMLHVLLGWLVPTAVAASSSSRCWHSQSHQIPMHPPTWSVGYPDLLLPTNIDDACDEDDLDSIPAVLNYVSPQIRHMNLRRDPTGRDVFLPSDLVAVVAGTAGLRMLQSLNSSSLLSLSPWDPREVSVVDGRNANLSLDANGFELVRSPLLSASSTTTTTTPTTIDFSDPNAVASVYYPVCEDLVRETFAARGGRRPVLVRAFDHNVRRADAAHEQDDDDDEAGGGNTLPPAGVVHNDYTAASAPRRLEQLASNAVHRNDVLASRSAIPGHLVQEAVQGKRRYAFVNVWRSIDATNPIQSYPLALMDSRSAAVFGDLRLLQIHYVDRVGENYLASFHKDHQWYYFPLVTMDDAILIKQWDSFGDLCHRRHETIGAASTLASSDSPRSTFALHTAFACRALRTNSSPPPPRKSIEVRCVCFWEQEEDGCDHDEEQTPGGRTQNESGSTNEE